VQDKLIGHRGPMGGTRREQALNLGFRGPSRRQAMMGSTMPRSQLLSLFMFLQAQLLMPTSLQVGVVMGHQMNTPSSLTTWMSSNSFARSLAIGD